MYVIHFLILDTLVTYQVMAILSEINSELLDNVT